MKAPVTLILAALTLAGCNTDNGLRELQGYRVDMLGTRPVLEGSHLALTFEQDGRLYGSTGCNHFFGRYQRDGKRLSVAELGSTRRFCDPTLARQETQFLTALRQVQRWDSARDGRVRLWPAEGAAIVLSIETD